MSYEEWAATLFPFEAKTLTRKEIFQAGAASRDAEIGMLITYLEYISSGELGPKICAALAKDALAKVRKPLAGLCPTKVGREAKPAG